jgi:hypothetical protein
MRARDPVVGTVDAQPSLTAPPATDHRDCLLQRINRLTRSAARTSHRRNRIPARSHAEDDSSFSTAQATPPPWPPSQVNQRQVRDVGHEPDVIGAGGGEREQRPRVEEPMLVRMILPAD